MHEYGLLLDAANKKIKTNNSHKNNEIDMHEGDQPEEQEIDESAGKKLTRSKEGQLPNLPRDAAIHIDENNEGNIP